MRASTQAITIEAPPERVWEFLVDLDKLPSWAIGFAKAIREEGGTWLVTTASGSEVELRTVVDEALGVVDYYMRDGPGAELPATTRVVPNEQGAEYVFTMFQAPEMPDNVFERQIAELGRELVVLKAHLESSCPL